MAGAFVLTIFLSQISFLKNIVWSLSIWYDGPIFFRKCTRPSAMPERAIEQKNNNIDEEHYDTCDR